MATERRINSSFHQIHEHTGLRGATLILKFPVLIAGIPREHRSNGLLSFLNSKVTRTTRANETSRTKARRSSLSPRVITRTCVTHVHAKHLQLKSLHLQWPNPENIFKYQYWEFFNSMNAAIF